MFCLTISPIHLLLWAAAKGLACDFLPYVLRRGHMLVLYVYIVHYTHDTYICCACDLYNMCVHETNVVRRGQVLVLYIPCNIVYNIVYYVYKWSYAANWHITDLEPNPGQVTLLK